jgi:uncharacterized membrane protein
MISSSSASGLLPPWESEIAVKDAIIALLGAYLLGVTLVLSPVERLVPAVFYVPPIVLVLVLVPGALILLSLDDEMSIDARFVLYAVGLSLFALMAVGFLINLTLPAVGIEHPLAVLPLAVSASVLVVTLVLLGLHRDSGEVVRVHVPDLLQPVPLVLLLLPLTSVIGVSVLNRTGNNLPLMAVLVTVAFLPIVMVLFVDERWYGLGVWTTALAILYHKSLSKYTGLSGSPGVVRTWREQRWTPGVSDPSPVSTELLQNGVLFPSIARLTSVNIFTELEVLNPFLVSFIPLALFVTFRRYVDPRKALVGAMLFAFAHPFYLQYPTAGRAATPVLFLALFGLVMSDDHRRSVHLTAFGLAFVTGIVVTHYGTSYFVMFAFLGALFVLLVFSYVDDILERLGVQEPVRADGSQLSRSYFSRLESGPGRVFRVSLALFFSIATVGWYMYANGGDSFSLPRHIARNVNQLAQGKFFSGRSAARLKRNYGTLSIRLSKLIYLAIGGLMGLGFLRVYYERFFTTTGSEFDDQYIALASLLMGAFVMTILLRNWGGGRPMMITFSFTAVFAVLGVLAISRFEHSIRNILPVWSSAGDDRDETGGNWVAIFGVILAVLFLINTSVVGAVVLENDRAPSNVLLQEETATSDSPRLRSSTYRETDIATHVWIVDHYTGSRNVYGDAIANGQTDWYLPAIEYGSERYAYPASPVSKPRGRLSELYDSGVEGGYVMILGHNLALDVVLARFSQERYELGELRPELDARHRVYANGDAQMYYATEPNNDDE